MSLKFENSVLHNQLKETERKKMAKTVRSPAVPQTHGNNHHSSQRKYFRRFNKSYRICRRAHFSEKRRSAPFVVNTDKLEHLNPINLSKLSLNKDHNKLLRKGPSFCPTPKDINWQEVHDDFECFEARLRAAVFLKKQPEKPEEPVANQGSLSHLLRIPGNKSWKPPMSRIPELELFFSNIRKDLLNPNNISIRDNLSKGERSMLRELKNSDVTIRIQDKRSCFVLINSDQYETKILGQLIIHCITKLLSQIPLPNIWA